MNRANDGRTGAAGAVDMRGAGVVAGAGVNLLALRSHNTALVLDLLRTAGAEGISRLELAERTGLTPQAVSKITARLREDGLATEAGRRASTGGKPRTVLRLVPEAGHAVGVHLDRDELRVVLVDLRGAVVEERRIALDLGAGAEAVLGAVTEAVAAVVAGGRSARPPEGALPGGDGGVVPGGDSGVVPGGGDGGLPGGLDGTLPGGDGGVPPGEGHRAAPGGGAGVARGEGDGVAPGGHDRALPIGPGRVLPGGPDVAFPGGPGRVLPGGPDVAFPGRPDVVLPGGPDVAFPGRPDVVLPGGPDVAFPGRPDVVLPGGPDVAYPGRPDVVPPGGPDVAYPGRPDVVPPGGADVAAPGGVDEDGAAPSRSVAGALANVLRGRGGGALLGVGVVLPGPLDHARGVLHRVTGFPEWDGFPLREALAGRLGVPVVVDKDTNAAALGLAVGGEGGSFAYLHLGTGLGAGLVIGGSVHRGARTGAGEFGHQVIQLDGPPCGCGDRGCVEALCLGAVARGDIEEAARVLGAGAANLVGLLDIDVVLLGGRTVTSAPEPFLRGVGAVLEERARRTGQDAVPVRLAPGGGRAVAVGAAQLVLGPVFGRGDG